MNDKAFANISLGLGRYISGCFLCDAFIDWRGILSILRSLKNLEKREWALWLCSVVVIVIAYLFAESGEWLTLIASLLGVTALIFVAKGDVLGQVIIIVFSLLYGIISFKQRYYGEIFTYVGMSAPIAAMSVVTWLRHPYSQNEVRISRISVKKMLVLLIATAVVTAIFYFILSLFGTASMLFSTISIATSFLASVLMLLRSPLYAAAYALNDIVLIVLWGLATVGDMSCLMMVICFAVFLVNDIYGFVNWLKMQKNQNKTG